LFNPLLFYPLLFYLPWFDALWLNSPWLRGDQRSSASAAKKGIIRIFCSASGTEHDSEEVPF
jgi:hypothetical protein